MKSDKEELEKSLENEKQKIEKIEKQTSGTQDLVKEKRDLQDKLAVVSKQLAQEQKRCENFETEANKFFELEEQLMISKEELTTFKAKFEEAEKILEKEKKSKEE